MMPTLDASAQVLIDTVEALAATPKDNKDRPHRDVFVIPGGDCPFCDSKDGCVHFGPQLKRATR